MTERCGFEGVVAVVAMGVEAGGVGGVVDLMSLKVDVAVGVRGGGGVASRSLRCDVL